MNKIFLRLQAPEGDPPPGGGGNPPPPSPSPPPPPPSPSPPPPPPAAWHGDAHKDYVTNKGWKSADDVITSTVNLEKLLGAEKAGRTAVLPKDANDVEGIKAFRAKIGVPEKADDYGLPVPDGQDAAFSKTAAAWFHANGIPKEAAQKITGEWNGYVAKVIADTDAQLKAESAKQLDGLRSKWGGEFDAKAEQARRFAKGVGWSDEKIGRYEAAFGTAEFLEDFAGLGAKLGEAKFVAGGGTGNQEVANARKELDELKDKRQNGKITQDEYLREMERLGPIASRAA